MPTIAIDRGRSSRETSMVGTAAPAVGDRQPDRFFRFIAPSPGR
jgi:hypothetical protein